METSKICEKIESAETKLKVVVCGETTCGKTSIVRKFTNEFSNHNVDSTIGATFLKKLVESNEKTIKFEIWDVSGLQRYRELFQLYYRQADVAIVLYDITKDSSYSHAQHILEELQEKASPDLEIALVGNKVDLEQNREVCTKTAESFARKNGLIFMETSAKTGFNVPELFKKIGFKFPRAISQGGANFIKQLRKGQVKVLKSGRKTSRYYDSWL